MNALIVFSFALFAAATSAVDVRQNCVLGEFGKEVCTSVSILPTTVRSGSMPCTPGDVNCWCMKAVEYTNDVRRENGVKKMLKVGPMKQLDNAVQYAEELDRRSGLKHQVLEEVTKEVECKRWIGGENIAYNYEEGDIAKACVLQWKRSKLHFENLVRDWFEEVVIGVHVARDGRVYCVQTFSLVYDVGTYGDLHGARCKPVSDDSSSPGGSGPAPDSEPSPPGNSEEPEEQKPSPSPKPPAAETPTPKPAGPSPKPAGPSPKPAGPSPKPAGPSPKPAGPSPKPGRPSPKPAGPSPKPTRPSPKPGRPSPKPTRPSPKPGRPSPKPSKGTGFTQSGEMRPISKKRGYHSCRCLEVGSRCWSGMRWRTGGRCNPFRPAMEQPRRCKKKCCQYCEYYPGKKTCSSSNVRAICKLR